MFSSCFGWIRCILVLSYEVRGSCLRCIGGSGVPRASATNEDILSILRGFAVISGSLEEASLVFLFCCSCFMNERRHLKHFAGICGSFGFVWGKPLCLPFQLSVLHSRTKTLSALSRQGGLFRVRWRKRSFSVIRALWSNEDIFSTLQRFAAVSGSLAALERSYVLRSWFAEQIVYKVPSFGWLGCLIMCWKFEPWLYMGLELVWNLQDPSADHGSQPNRPRAPPTALKDDQLQTNTCEREAWNILKQCHAAALSINARPGNPRAKWLSPSCCPWRPFQLYVETSSSSISPSVHRSIHPSSHRAVLFNSVPLRS